MSSLVDDTVNEDGVGGYFVHDAVGIHADLAHVFFTDFRHDSAEARQVGQRCHFVGNVLNHALGVAFGIVRDVLMDQPQVFAGP